ncbi:hypothetical protein P7C73_g670, partial [Tremellales sp. Uapishka_1]
MADHKKSEADACVLSSEADVRGDGTVIVQFKKTSSAEDRAKIVSDLKDNKGAVIHSEENLNSKIYPFITISLPEDHFDALKSEALTGNHAVVDHVEEDKEVSIN